MVRQGRLEKDYETHLQIYGAKTAFVSRILNQYYFMFLSIKTGLVFVGGFWLMAEVHFAGGNVLFTFLGFSYH